VTYQWETVSLHLFEKSAFADYGKLGQHGSIPTTIVVATAIQSNCEEASSNRMI
jgi:hypothetical protein